MRTIFPILALTLATGVAAEPRDQTLPPGLIAPPVLQAPPEGRVPCRDTIHAVREERGLPQLRRGPATLDEALLIAAVDRRIDGCAVMVMRNNTSDVRPLSAIPKGSGRLQPIPGG